MKILLVDLETQWRGGQNQALLMLQGFKARGHSAELVAAEGSVLGERAAASGVAVHSVSRRFSGASAAWKISDLIRNGRFDLVHANEAHGVTAVWLARARRRVPFLISRRVGYPIGKSRLARARYEAAARIVPISDWVAKQLAASGTPKEKMSIVYEGIAIPTLPSSDARRQARIRWGVPGGAPLLGCVGVLLPDKGQQFLIQALAQVRGEFPGCKLLLSGDGPNRGTLEELSRQLGVHEAVIFAGFVSDIDAVYAALDVFLFPSRFEGLGTSLLAAMSYEVPSVAFSCCAFGEIIEEGRSGLLVQVGNIGEIAAAVARLLRDPGFARAMGEAGRRRAREVFSSERMVEEMIKVYEQVSVRN